MAERQNGLRVWVRPGDGLGFRLAGVAVDEVAAGDEAPSIQRVMADAAVHVLAVEEDVLRAVPEVAVRRAAVQGVPVLLPFALPKRWGGPSAGQAYVAALIRRAIGYHIKLETGGAR